MVREGRGVATLLAGELLPRLDVLRSLAPLVQAEAQLGWLVVILGLARRGRGQHLETELLGEVLPELAERALVAVLDVERLVLALGRVGRVGEEDLEARIVDRRALRDKDLVPVEIVARILHFALALGLLERKVQARRHRLVHKVALGRSDDGVGSSFGPRISVLLSVRYERVHLVIVKVGRVGGTARSVLLVRNGRSDVLIGQVQRIPLVAGLQVEMLELLSCCGIRGIKCLAQQHMVDVQKLLGILLLNIGVVQRRVHLVASVLLELVSDLVNRGIEDVDRDKLDAFVLEIHLRGAARNSENRAYHFARLLDQRSQRSDARNAVGAPHEIVPGRRHGRAHVYDVDDVVKGDYEADWRALDLI
ncbi:hypothetical protein L1887_56638 [Cichorium endivia]|nr:hypothetical protein L1887_56638 [Cichorium endivia]